MRYGALDHRALFARVQHPSIGVLSGHAASDAQGRRAFGRSHQRYFAQASAIGYRQVTNRLRRKRIAINAKRSLRLMRSHDLQNKPLWRPAMERRTCCRSAYEPFTVRTGGSRPTVAYGHYLRAIAITLDLFGRSNRRIQSKVHRLGPRNKHHHRTDAGGTRMALVSRRPKATLVHHSDRGTHYRSSAYQDALLERGLTSFSRPGIARSPTSVKPTPREARSLEIA